MHLHYFYEDTPLGTAGGVKACRDFLGQEDFLVISGDCVSDFDLTDSYRLHRQRQAEATLLLHRVAEPLEYGLVRTDQEGRVLAFVEKPGWGQVFTDQVNTGIYLLSPSVLDLVPEGEPFDFSKNLFPELLRQKRALYGQVPAGYWRDMGECGSYLQTVEDALEGRVKLDMTLPQQSTGVWSAEPIPDSVEVLAPCWIGSDVTLDPWSNIGPHTVLEPWLHGGAGLPSAAHGGHGRFCRGGEPGGGGDLVFPRQNRGRGLPVPWLRGGRRHLAGRPRHPSASGAPLAWSAHPSGQPSHQHPGTRPRPRQSAL